MKILVLLESAITFSIPVGQVGQFGKTFVVPEACYTRPPEEFPENSAFLYVFEN